MFSKIFIVVSISTLCLYLYGILTMITEIEDNSCKMTYMFEFPTFVKVSFKENDDFPKYNLYAYSEGHLTEQCRMGHFTGAPVLFIHGNAGSYKQARSLASVALRKGIDRGYQQHLDYFSVDLNEEYSALFGGVLDEQTKFTEICVKTILGLYKKMKDPPTNVIIIGHSMGGKIAQALLLSDEIRPSIHTIINLATPMDQPVIALDFQINGYYRKIEEFWSKNRDIIAVTNETNFCDKRYPKKSKMIEADQSKNSKRLLDDKLLITIGGGSRDLLVDAGLTASKYSDVHAITTTIPNVWLSTDHLCSVWCLQLMLVVNRYLFSILLPQSTRSNLVDGFGFTDDRDERLRKAQHYFRRNQILMKNSDEVNLNAGNRDPGLWIENSKRIFTERFKSGTNRTYVQMFRLFGAQQHKMLYVEVINLETNDWIFGCAANEMTPTMRYCATGTSITSKYMKKMPSVRHERNIIKIDLHDIKKQHPEWTHVILRFLPTNEPFQLNVDVHNRGEREINVVTPKWYSFSPVKILEETLHGSSLYNIRINGLEMTHQAMELIVKPKSCSLNQYHAVAKVCVPWTEGFNRYHYFTESRRKPFYIYPPQQRPSNGYNTSTNPVNIELNLDPSCRYTISLKNSLGMTMAKVVQQYSHWLPAHLVAILLLALKHQISLTPTNEAFKCGTLHKSLLKSSSFFIITASRVFVKIILWTQFLPEPDQFNLPISLSIVIHGSCLAILTFATGAIFAGVTFFGNCAHKILFKLVKLPIPTISGILVPIIQKFPLTIGVLLISIAMGSCGAVSLILASVVYFILLTKMYEDYLEEFVFKTAKIIARKLFGRKQDQQDGEGNDDEDEEKDEEKTKVDETKEANNKPKTGEQPKDKADDDLDRIEQILDKIENEEDEELERLLQETLERQRKQQQEKRDQDKETRVEYDSVHSGLSTINFHLPLFFLLVILTILNLPSAITWAKNYQFSTTLNPDPSQVPSLITLVSLSALWQLPTPRNILGYRIISSVLYISALICVLYCQDSVYRLNAVISTVFLLTTLHQICGRRFYKFEFAEEEDEELRDKIYKLRAALAQEQMEAEAKASVTEATSEENIEIVDDGEEVEEKSTVSNVKDE